MARCWRATNVTREPRRVRRLELRRTHSQHARAAQSCSRHALRDFRTTLSPLCPRCFGLRARILRVQDCHKSVTDVQQMAMKTALPKTMAEGATVQYLCSASRLA